MRPYLLFLLLISGTCWATEPTTNDQIGQGFSHDLLLAQANISPVAGLTAAFVTDTTYHETWYVSQNGAGNGTSVSNPMGLTALNAKTDFGTSNGDVAIFLIGTINDTVKLSKSGLATGHLIIRGDYPGQPATIQVNGGSGEEAFDLSGLRHIDLYNANSRAIIDGQVVSGGPDDIAHENDQLINLANSSHITIDNWEIKRGWNGIKSDNVSDFNLFRCKVTLNRINGAYFGSGSEQILIGGSSSNANDFYQNTYKTSEEDSKIGADLFFHSAIEIKVTHNEIHAINNDEQSGWGMIGVGFYGVDRGLVEKNTIHDMGAFNFTAGIFAKGLALNRNLIFRYNNLYDLTTVQGADDGGGIFLTGDANNIRIYGNRIHNAQSGIGVDINGDGTTNIGNNGNHIEDVFIWANSISSVNAYGIALLDTLSANTDDYDDIYIVNNSIHMTTEGSSEHMTSFISQFNYGSGDDGTDDTGANPHIIVKNNIFSEGRFGQMRKFNIAANENSDGNWMALDYNIGYDSTDDGNYTIRFGPSSDGSDDFNYDSGSLPAAWCANDPTPANPMFTDEANGNLELGPSSPAISQAIDMSGVDVPPITVDGTAYSFDLDDILYQATNWSTIPPTIHMADHDDYGEDKTIGAYIGLKYVNSIYYVSPTGGTGTRDGKSVETAWSAADLRSETTNWSFIEDIDKLDPGDILYPKENWTNSDYLNVHQGITIDFYESGDYDPITMDHSLSPVFKSQIYVKSNDVNVQDGRFDWSARAIIINERVKRQRIKVLRNYFNVSRYGGWAAVYWGFVCDSEFAYNYVEGIPQDNCSTTTNAEGYGGRGFVLCAGSRNRIHHNYIDGGYTAFYFPGSRTWDDDKYTVDYPPSGVYTADPDANYEKNEISYNHIERRCQEGISYDVTGSPTEPYGCSIVERDTVTSVNGTTITLSNSEWTGKGNLYSGYYIAAIPNRDNTFGKHALIESQSDNSFTVSSAISNLAVGDSVVIGMVFRRNWIHHNTFGNQGFFGSSILLQGFCLENLVEYNEFPQVHYTEAMGIHISTTDGYVKAHNNVTETYASGPTAYNIVRYNTAGRLHNSVHRYNYGPLANIFNRNDAWIENTLHDNPYYTRYIYLNRSNAYVYNSGPVSTSNDGGKRTTDPTGYVSDWFTNNW